MTERILLKPEVQSKVGKSDATIYREEMAGRFPQRIKLGANSVGWLESEVEEWLDNRIKQSRHVAQGRAV